MAHSPEKKIALRAAYVGGLPLEAAAERAGVPLGTARRWFAAEKRAGDDWDRAQKAALTVAGGGARQALDRIVAAALVRCEVLLEALAAADIPIERAMQYMGVLADTISKLEAANRRAGSLGERLRRATEDAETGRMNPEEALRRVREELYGG